MTSITATLLDCMGRLRCAPDAQEESRILAMQISVEMVKRYPVSWAALRGIH